jgi:hypothetical protein
MFEMLRPCVSSSLARAMRAITWNGSMPAMREAMWGLALRGSFSGRFILSSGCCGVRAMLDCRFGGLRLEYYAPTAVCRNEAGSKNGAERLP